MLQCDILSHDGSPGQNQKVYLLLSGFALVALLVAVGPLFVCMPPCCDLTYHDICARAVLRGDHFYQEVLYINVPGMVLTQSFLRALLGWRTESLRVVDFLVVTAIIFLLVCKALPSSCIWT